MKLIQKEYAGKYKMVMQGSQQGTVVTKIETVSAHLSYWQKAPVHY